MKSIFKLNIDASQIKGAIGNIKELQGESKVLQSDLGDITKDLLNNTPGGVTALSKLRSGVDKLKGSVGSLTDRFTSMGMTIRGIATNAFSKLGSVLKTGMMAAGALIGAVTGIFNMANGTNRTQTDAAFAGLSYAEQKALNDANEETGFNADFATNRAGFHQGADSMAAKALLQGGLLSEGEFDRLKNDSQSYYKLNDKLYSEYKRIRSESPEESVADETFKQMYGNVLSQFGYGDFATFKLANQNGVLDRHKQTFSDTHQAYSGVDANALMKGERALNQFSETLKAFALGVAAKFLPGLTKGLKSLTGLFQKVGNYVKESGLLTEIADSVGSLVELIISAGEAIVGLISKLMGSSVTEYVKDVFGATSSFFKGTTAWIKGDKESRDRYYKEAKEKRDAIHQKNLNVAGNIAGNITEAITGSEEAASIANKSARQFFNGIYAGTTTLEEGVGKVVKQMEESKEKGLINKLSDVQWSEISKENAKRLDEILSKENNYSQKNSNTTMIPLVVNVDNKQASTQTLILEQQTDTQGRIMNQQLRRGL